MPPPISARSPTPPAAPRSWPAQARGADRSDGARPEGQRAAHFRADAGQPRAAARAIRELVRKACPASYAGTFVIDVTADIEDAYSLNKVLDEFAIERTWPNRDERFFASSTAATPRCEATRQRTRRSRSKGAAAARADLRMGRQFAAARNLAAAGSRLQMYFALHQRARSGASEDVHEDYVRLLRAGTCAPPKACARAYRPGFRAADFYARSLRTRHERQDRQARPLIQERSKDRQTDTCASKR